jgi:hypothetical protein
MWTSTLGATTTKTIRAGTSIFWLRASLAGGWWGSLRSLSQVAQKLAALRYRNNIPLSGFQLSSGMIRLPSFAMRQIGHMNKIPDQPMVCDEEYLRKE